MSTSDKATLIPARVPWQVVPSTPLLHLCAGENENAIVRFAAHFRLEQPDIDMAIASAGSEAVRIVADSLSGVTAGGQRGPYKVVKTTFGACPWARIMPAFSGSQVIDEAAYDWSAVGGQMRDGETLGAWSKRTHEEWLNSGVSPDPRFYEVRNSSWIAEAGAARYGMKHFLIKGHDSYIEVIADGWSWEVERILEGW